MTSGKPSCRRTRDCKLPLPTSVYVAFCICTVNAAQIVVCPTGNADTDCKFSGNVAIQSAVDIAKDGDSILIRSGIYYPVSYRDVQFDDVVIRGYVVIDGKNINLTGESETVLDGATGEWASAFVVAGGIATIDNFTIRNFRAQLTNDDLYDGHGIFILSSKAEIKNVSLQEIAKMSISVRGSSIVKLNNVEMVDGHVGVWVEEDARINIENSLFRNNDSAGVAAYASSFANIRNSIFDSNLDDGIYAEDEAVIVVSNSVFIGNKPFAIRGIEDSQIVVNFCVFHNNQDKLSTYTNTDQIKTGQNIFDVHPGTDDDYRPMLGSPLIDAGDPEILDRDGSVSDIGLYGGPEAAALEALK